MLYKENIWDKLLRAIYVDLANLPVSVFRYDDWMDKEYKCCELGSELIGNRKIGAGKDCVVALHEEEADYNPDLSKSIGKTMGNATIA